ncbi:SDR family NAD(P)-dependent oxidoreductase [Aquidulcibacter sp.]|uniref:SDR family NAD(P)-dependent oxidoreductase n=1 Tax=Aquidulcibacter sp. TaxID=2052990 RepID=UPI0037C0CE52
MSRTIVVTGASRGLGLHIAQRARATGFKVIGISRSGESTDGFEILKCDIADCDSIKAVAKEITKSEQVWGVVNAAGVAAMNLAMTTPSATVNKVVSINLLGSIYVAQAFAKHFVRNQEGRLINFSTIAVPLGLSGESVYVASKAGVEGFSRTFAREMSEHNVTVNCIAPGPIDTDLIAKVPSAAIDKIVAQQVIKRKGTPEDIWSVASFLLSDQANMVSGQVINVGGA